MKKPVEKVSTGPLKTGSLSKIKKRAKSLGFVKANNEPHISKYLESLMEGDMGCQLR